MEIYLAGAYSRPYLLKDFINDNILGRRKLQNPGIEDVVVNTHTHTQRKKKNNENVKVYLAGEHGVKNGGQANWKGVSILESFAYAENNKHIPKLIKYENVDFLLDSGAFTFLERSKKTGSNIKINWEGYIERYANFINLHKVDLFFELDIDPVVGLKEVERLRERLHKLTGKKSIPVWHKARGRDYWLRMLDEFDYVSLGGMAGNVGYKDKVEKMFPWFLKTAKAKNTKVHSLGYTSLKGLRKYKFDSVDSTAWLYGNRGGYLYKFTGDNLIQIKKPEGKKMKSRDVALNNFMEWVKFQQYAKKYL